MNPIHRLAATAALACGLAAAHATPIVVNVAGAQSVNLQGDAGNTVWLVNVGANAVLTALDWSVALNAFAPSTLSEMQVSFGSSSGLDQLTLAPGAADLASGTGSYTGSLSLAGLGAGAGADGLLRIEFSEGYKDFGLNVVEGQWLGGTLTFDVTAAAVPEPAAGLLALLGLGALGARTRGIRKR